jgi:rubrerythrin
MRNTAPARRVPKGHVHAWRRHESEIYTLTIDGVTTRTVSTLWLCHRCGHSVTRKPKDAPD